MAYKLADAFIQVGTKGLSLLGSAFMKAKNIVAGALSSIASMAGKFGALAGGISLVGAVKIAKDAVELENLFTQVFKEGTAQADAFARELAQKIGRSVLSIKEEMSNFQAVFVPLGFARKEAAKMSETMATLTEDLASFWNRDSIRTSELLRSAIVGNHRAALSFGITIKNADLKQELFRMGMDDNVQTASSYSKAMARVNLILRQSRDAMGDAEDTAGSFENRMKGFLGAIKDVTATIGKAFLPALSNIAKAATDFIRKWEPVVVEWSKTWAKIGEVATTRWDLTWKIIKQATAVGLLFLRDAFSKIPEVIAFGFATGLRARMDMIVAFFKAITDTGTLLWSNMIRGWLEILADMQETLTGVKIDLFDIDEEKQKAQTKSKLKRIWDAAFDGFNKRGMRPDIFGLSDATKGAIGELKKTLGEFSDEVEKVEDVTHKFRPDQGGDPTVGMLKVDKMELPTGFIDFDKANQKIQEALLAQKDPQEKMVGALDEGNMLAQQQIFALNRIEDRLGTRGGFGGAVARA